MVIEEGKWSLDGEDVFSCELLLLCFFLLFVGRVVFLNCSQLVACLCVLLILCCLRVCLWVPKHSCWFWCGCQTCMLVRPFPSLRFPFATSLSRGKGKLGYGNMVLGITAESISDPEARKRGLNSAPCFSMVVVGKHFTCLLIVV